MWDNGDDDVPASAVEPTLARGGDDQASLDFLAVDYGGSQDSTDIDFLVTDNDGGEDGPRDALPPCADSEPPETGTGLDAICPRTEHDDEEPAVSTFTVTNPSGTVSVSALIDGAAHEVELSAALTHLTESELADEILVIAGLARQKALSAQRTFIFESIGQLEGETEKFRDLMEQFLDLPTPEQAAAEEAAVFARRYVHDDK
ncbi:hypothetical protein [Mycobacterium pseudokansasii]|uniref:ESX-1 secretion-associated protein EspH n=1 Tax=Mycobacterium pseudokansasii TaxID=2341080 RepID=A0A498R0H3_9MYCO|nr:hypothetical protein [Mycobacterium pseudokansasii]KZS60552.1 hypothetical protein A4G27_08785 [Mycobacterium kansasii]VBA30538.1 ESX-1 secretion-associated protein EspH [Mycobacterium pseudokansasii]VBA32358.1 ESX-1 secretion-associated protein EspH [Mycobacterium pseudokansasii]VBA54459.1 ESX-1 secretion-associated protein EspH [Mycobacterium pseudokansasii]